MKRAADPRRALWGLALLAAAAAGAQEPAPAPDAYTFKLNGVVLTPQIVSMDCSPQVRPGDLAMINGILIVLGEPGAYVFDVPLARRERLYRVKDGGARELIGVRVAWAMREGERVLVNPFDELDDAQVAGLRGVYCDYWDEKLERRLKLLDPAACCVTATDLTGAGPFRAVPALPENLRFLTLYEKHGVGFRDFAPLKRLKELRFLALVTFGEPRFDAAVLAEAARLRYLDLTSSALAHPEALAGLAELRCLNLNGCKDLRDAGFLKSLPELVGVELERTGLADLSPLAGHPKLVTIRASGSPVTKLPEGRLPVLEDLELLRSPTPDDEVERFRKENPQCAVLFKLEKMFAALLADADAVLVRPRVANYLPNAEAAKEAKEVKDPERLRTLRECMALDLDEQPLPCACSTGPFLEFMKVGRHVATVAFRHNESAEWLGGKLGNWPLSKESIRLLIDWLAADKLPQPAAQDALPAFPNPMSNQPRP
ncbi:MAG: hypothetical protein M5U26_15655 [Planctomycetota bacterium]|nr:hypothetical protein [Planctomycetota bacterium]